MTPTPHADTGGEPRHAAAETCDVAIIGAGAAGLFAGIWAGRAARAAGKPLRVIALDGARRVGAKILVAGGGRCNVTHWKVDEHDYCGSTAPARRKVLQAFGADRTVAFFAELGVELKQEETGKLFPVTDDAQTVLDALLWALSEANARLRHPTRVSGVQRSDGGFRITGEWGALHASRVVLCTGGMALPKSGSDGAGYAFARALGHTITEPVVPALVPLVLQDGHWLRALSGLTLPAILTLRSATGKVLARTAGSTLCTHFGISGPAVLDISRHLLVARMHDPGATLEACWVPARTPAASGASARPPTRDEFDQLLRETTGRPVLTPVRAVLPERMARAMCTEAGIAPGASIQQVSRDARRRLAELATECPLPVVVDRGYSFAEATAGGVPLSEVRLDTMESRITPGLYLAGEICDVDGRIGGFNFQWAWASGYLAGRAAAAAPAVLRAS